MDEFSKKTREEMVSKLVDNDIVSIFDSNRQDDYSFLNSVLRGDGWRQYNQLTDEEIKNEYEDMESRDD